MQSAQKAPCCAHEYLKELTTLVGDWRRGWRGSRGRGGTLLLLRQRDQRGKGRQRQADGQDRVRLQVGGT